MKILIIGSGLSSLWLTQELLGKKKDFEITIVTNERGPFYSRPMLTHSVVEEGNFGRIAVESFDSLRGKGVTLFSESHVDSIDREKKEVVVGDRRLTYDLLILATGSRAKIPNEWLSFRDQFLVFNKLTDLEQIREIRKNKKEIRWLIVGGGLIGCELAAELNRAGDEVTISHSNGRLIDRQLTEEQSQKLQEFFNSRQINVLLNSRDILSQGLSNLQNRYDQIILAAGFAPRVELAKLSGIDCANGILTDQFLRTNDPSIFAVGDVAQVSQESGQLLYPFIMPIRSQVKWLAAFLNSEVTTGWVAPNFKPMIKIDGFKLT